MPTPFLSSEEYDERAHQLYNEGQYDEALTVLREGLALYPTSVELHIGVGYARLAREEFAWARRSFEEALVLEPEHEDALAGLGETLLKFGLEEAALRCFRRTLELGYADEGFWGCTAVGYCSVVCPKGVDPANAINQNKMSSAINYFTRFVSGKEAGK